MTERTTAERPLGGSLMLTRRVRPWYLVIAVAAAALIVVAARFMQPPSTVSRLTVDNPTKFDLSVAVSDDGEGWMSVGSARRETSTAFKEVVDQGDTWYFRFSAQGEDSETLQLSKADLQKAGWALEVPQSVSDDLRAKGAEFPP